MFAMNLIDFSKIIDHTNIKPQADFKDIGKLCSEAKRYKFGCICVNPFFVKYAVGLVKGSSTVVGSTCGFPFGAHRTDVKVYEAKKAISDGAKEIDTVINIGALRSKKYKIVKNDIRALSRLCKKKKVILKVILEMNLLRKSEKVAACKIVRDAGADFLKSGTGLWGPAKISDIRLMKKIAGNKCRVKASGGIKTLKQVKSFIKAGAERIGTSSSVNIFKELKKL